MAEKKTIGRKRAGLVGIVGIVPKPHEQPLEKIGVDTSTRLTDVPTKSESLEVF